jgi:hypothetical protein
LLIIRHVSALTVDHFQGACNFFLACAAYAATYVVGILHIIIIIIINVHEGLGVFILFLAPLNEVGLSYYYYYYYYYYY